MLNVIKMAKLQRTIGGLKTAVGTAMGVGVKGLLAAGKRKILIEETPKDTLKIPLTKFDSVDKSWLPKKDTSATRPAPVGGVPSVPDPIRPLSAPHRPRVKAIATNPYHFDSEASEKKEKNVYSDCIGLGGGTTIKRKKDAVHVVVDDHGNLVGIALKSKSLPKRPKSATTVTFKGSGKYGIKKKKRINQTVEVSAIKRNLNSNYGIVKREKLPRSVQGIDYEAADKRRLKTVAHSRYRMKLIGDKQVLQTREIADLCRSKDVTYHSNLTAKTKIFGQLDVEIVERNALKHIFNTMKGVGWTHKGNWFSDRPLNEWHGIVTNHLGNVIELNLSNNNLHGELSPYLGDFKNLEVLILDNNFITGTLKPNIIHNLKKLEILSLRNNQLTDDIPLKTIAECEDLRELWLSKNRFTGTLHEDVGNIKNLTHFCVYNNYISGKIPESIGKCLKLELLSMGRNHLTGEIPDSLKNCTKLTHISLYNNHLCGQVPSWISLLLDLIEVNLFGNNFDGEVPLRIAEEELGLVKR
jgi:Leucine-rich repeat (LRR) protein